MTRKLTESAAGKIISIALVVLLLFVALGAGMATADATTEDVAVTALSAPSETTTAISESTSDGQSFWEQIVQNFAEKGRYSYVLEGLKNTLIITVFALILGMALGALLAVVRTVHDLNGRLRILNVIAKVYLTVIRGTPVLVQLLIIYYVIFATVDVAKIFVAVVAFGLNSAAYVAEIIRAGINAVPKGQFEAGYSLGLSFKNTMFRIILPQAIKNILPALCNEGITLIKETSISGYISIVDLTKAGDIIRSQTYSALIPLFGVALIYLTMVLILTALVHKLELHLNKSNGVITA